MTTIKETKKLPTGTWCTFLAAGLVLATACEQLPVQNSPIDAGSLPTEHLVHFRQRKAFIQKVGESISAPAFAGSVLSPKTLNSSSPDTVGIADNGKLIGRKAGRALISAAGGEVLDVQVLDVRDFRLSPSKLTLTFGEPVKLTAMSSDGTPIDNDAFQWLTTNPSIVDVSGATLVAGQRTGTAHITAVLGPLQATVFAIVTGSGKKTLSLEHPVTRLRVGQINRYLVAERVAVHWSSSNPKILALLNDPGSFRAANAGLATVCALGDRDHACVDVEVTK